MGKSKKRSIALGKHNQITNLSREEAVLKVIQNLKTGDNIFEIISLFGLRPEELLEAGADYESVKSIEEFF